MVWMGVLSFLFLVCSFRTNICFVIVFISLTLAFAFLTAAYWLFAEDFTGNAAKADSLMVVSSPNPKPLLRPPDHTRGTG